LLGNKGFLLIETPSSPPSAGLIVGLAGISPALPVEIKSDLADAGCDKVAFRHENT
jgi:hypothetical protein